MLSTTGFRRGDVGLVNFPFTEASNQMRRPVVVLSSESYHLGRREVIVAAVTSNTGRLLAGDSLIADWESAGLLFPSVVTGILRTIRQAMMQRRLGSLSARDMDTVEEAVRIILGLDG